MANVHQQIAQELGVREQQVEAAQQQIIAIVRQLESEGAISLKGTVGEQYVV